MAFAFILRSRGSRDPQEMLSEDRILHSDWSVTLHECVFPAKNMTPEELEVASRFQRDFYSLPSMIKRLWPPKPYTRGRSRQPVLRFGARRSIHSLTTEPPTHASPGSGPCGRWSG